MKAKYSRLNLRLAFILMKRDYWDKKHEKMGLCRALFTFLLLELPALIVEHYCLKRFDVLITGNDTLAQLLICIRLAKSGKTTLAHECAPDSDDYETVIENSQRLITQSELNEIESLIGESLGECNSYESLLRKLGEVLSRLNSKRPMIFFTRGISLVNSGFSALIASSLPNFCPSYYQGKDPSNKPYGMIPFTIRENQNKWFANYQCALSFNDVIILTKLNSSLSDQFFQNAVNFPKLKVSIGENWVYTAENRIHDLKALMTEVERRIQ